MMVIIDSLLVGGWQRQVDDLAEDGAEAVVLGVAAVEGVAVVPGAVEDLVAFVGVLGNEAAVAQPVGARRRKGHVISGVRERRL